MVKKVKMAGKGQCDSTNLPKPTPAQLAWQNFEIGLLYSFDMIVYEEGVVQGDDATAGGGKFELAQNMFNPARLDTDQWLEAAKAVGAKYAIFTATHTSGFLHWQSDLYPYGLKQSKWCDGKGDIVKDFVESCHRYGIKPALFIGLRFNKYWDVEQYQIKGDDKKKQSKYIQMCEQMVEELCSRYGELAEVWIEGGALSPEQGGPDILPIVEKYQPNTIFYHSEQRRDHRWVGNESGWADYPCWATMASQGGFKAHANDNYREMLPHGDPNGKFWSPAMCDIPIRKRWWFWHPDQDHLLSPLDSLRSIYYQSVGRNANLVLGAVPNRNGLIPDADMKRYQEFGAEIRRRFSKPIAETTGEGNVVELILTKPSKINHVIIMEDIAFGERVRAYEIEGLVHGNTWQKICDGISIGHKRIQQFESVEVAKVRFRCTKSVVLPKIRKMAVYNVE